MTCRHDLPEETCAICKGHPRDRLAEVIDDATTTCSSKRCGAEVVWALTVNNRRMPVDVDPVDGGTVELYLEGPDIRARVLSAKRLPTAGQLGLGGPLELRTSHFATCPAAAEFRGGSTRPA